MSSGSTISVISTRESSTLRVILGRLTSIVPPPVSRGSLTGRRHSVQRSGIGGRLLSPCIIVVAGKPTTRKIMNLSRQLSCLWALCLVMVLVSPAWGQAGIAEVQGEVVDLEDNPIQGAEVTFVNATSSQSTYTETHQQEGSLLHPESDLHPARRLARDDHGRGLRPRARSSSSLASRTRPWSANTNRESRSGNRTWCALPLLARRRSISS